MTDQEQKRHEAAERIAKERGVSYETANYYLDLREEGYPRYQALLMAGIMDPDEGDQ